MEPTTLFWSLQALVGAFCTVLWASFLDVKRKAVGGAKDSAHMLGLAADINVDGYTPKQLATLIKASGLEVDQLILEFSEWVHVGLSLTPYRHQTLTINKGTGYMQGLV